MDRPSVGYGIVITMHKGAEMEKWVHSSLFLFIFMHGGAHGMNLAVLLQRQDEADEKTVMQRATEAFASETKLLQEKELRGAGTQDFFGDPEGKEPKSPSFVSISLSETDEEEAQKSVKKTREAEDQRGKKKDKVDQLLSFMRKLFR